MVFTCKLRSGTEGPSPVHPPKPMNETLPQMREPALDIFEIRGSQNFDVNKQLRSFSKSGSWGPCSDTLINQFSILNLYTWGARRGTVRHFPNVNPVDSPNNPAKCRRVDIHFTAERIEPQRDYIISQSSALCQLEFGPRQYSPGANILSCYADPQIITGLEQWFLIEVNFAPQDTLGNVWRCLLWMFSSIPGLGLLDARRISR